MTADYAPLVVLVLLAAAVAAGIPLLAALAGRDRPGAAKGAPFECGVAELDSMRKRTTIRYYMTALLFIVFDIDVAFLYPWAVAIWRFRPAAFALAEMAVFLGILAITYAWVWKKGALEWD